MLERTTTLAFMQFLAADASKSLLSTSPSSSYDDKLGSVGGLGMAVAMS
jgi:hypothetical protein